MSELADWLTLAVLVLGVLGWLAFFNWDLLQPHQPRWRDERGQLTMLPDDAIWLSRGMVVNVGAGLKGPLALVLEKRNVGYAIIIEYRLLRWYERAWLAVKEWLHD